MRLDNVKEAETFWYEDSDGNHVKATSTYEAESYPVKTQHMLFPVVEHIVRGDGFKGDKWPIRALKWMISKMPSSWKKDLREYSSNINIYDEMFPIIKYLIDMRNFSFRDATAIAAELCTNCRDITYSEITNTITGKSIAEYDSCKYCKDIDPRHYNITRTTACYMTYANSGDVSWAFENRRPDDCRDKDIPVKVSNDWLRSVTELLYNLAKMRMSRNDRK